MPVHNMAGPLRQCLDALAAQGGDTDFVVVVVDDASTDDSARVAATHPASPIIIRLPSRSGSYAARNAGAAALAHVDALGFTDADCIPRPNWVDEGLHAVLRQGIVGGAVQMRLPVAPNCWARYDGAMHLDQETHVHREGYGATANLWVRSDIWREVGEFLASLRSGGDFEWGRRAAANGHAVSYAGECIVDHPPRSTALATWLLHQRLGSGWSQLAELGLWPKVHHDLALRTPMSYVLSQCERRRIATSYRQLVVPHAVAMAARLAGRVAVRGRRARK